MDARLEWYKKIRSASKYSIYLSNFYERKNGEHTEYVLGKWVEWPSSMPLPPLNPYHHRTVLSREIVFDIDTPEWAQVRNAGQRLLNYFELKNIPYIMGQSGGKGVHIHVFLKFTETFKTVLDNVITNEGLDVAREIRMIFYNHVLASTGLKDLGIFDESLVGFSSQSMGHMVREFGGTKMVNVNGTWEAHYKTFIKRIPDQRIWVKNESDVKYPDELPFFEININSEFAEVLLKGLSAKNKKIEEMPKINIDSELPDLEYLKLPCIKDMMSQRIPEGRRNMAGKVLSAVCMKNKSIKYCETFLESWYNKYYLGTDFKFREIQDWLKTFDKKSKEEIFFSCPENLKIIGKSWDFCKNSNCPVYKKIQEARNGNGKVVKWTKI